MDETTQGIDSIFYDDVLISKIKDKLPKFFQLAEEDNSRDGKIGMEIGSARERILISLFDVPPVFWTPMIRFDRRLVYGKTIFK